MSTDNNRAASAAAEFMEMDELSRMSSPVHRLSPLSKLWITVLYIFTVVSFSKYDIFGLFVMVLFPVTGYQLSGLPVSLCFRKLRAILPLVMAVGIVNPFLDRQILFSVGGIAVSAGFVSMITLMMKGVFCLMMSFLLVASTGIEGICCGLRRIRCPEVMTTLLLLTYRYIAVLLDEVAVMTQAYHLRAPGQKGIQISAWGSFLGQLVLRSMDRAQGLYESMVLRGFHGDFYAWSGHETRWSAMSLAAAAGCTICFLACRWYNIPVLLGNLMNF